MKYSYFVTSDLWKKIEKETLPPKVGYNVSMTKDYLSAAFPKIEQEDESAPQPKEKAADKPVVTGKKETKSKPAATSGKIPSTTPENKTENDPANAVMLAMIGVARKMKEEGLAIDTIA